MTSSSQPYVIDLRVGSVEGLFSAFDPSPFRERDLDPRAVEHIEQWATDAPADVPLLLKLHVPAGPGQEGAADTEEAVRRYFEYEAHLLSRTHRRNRGRALRWFATGVLLMTLLLWFDAWIGRAFPDTFVSDIISEALVIAGWVSVWLPIERFGFDNWMLRDRLRLFERLSKAGVEIVSDARE